MRILLFGQEECYQCSSIKQKVPLLLKRWDASDVTFDYYDVKTSKGRSAVGLYQVRDTPTTLVIDGEEVARWVGKIPTTDSLREALGRS